MGKNLLIKLVLLLSISGIVWASPNFAINTFHVIFYTPIAAPNSFPSYSGFEPHVPAAEGQAASNLVGQTITLSKTKLRTTKNYQVTLAGYGNKPFNGTLYFPFSINLKGHHYNLSNQMAFQFINGIPQGMKQQHYIFLDNYSAICVWNLGQGSSTYDYKVGIGCYSTVN